MWTSLKPLEKLKLNYGTTIIKKMLRENTYNIIMALLNLF